MNDKSLRPGCLIRPKADPAFPENSTVWLYRCEVDLNGKPTWNYEIAVTDKNILMVVSCIEDGDVFPMEIQILHGENMWYFSIIATADWHDYFEIVR
ncbi:hypothetical protein C4565_08370 [Candidatus Parcubacteria bacterium]|nr:MAG: hypothetical protein C4565_08370 [Candidatus Parcubacteria bacterium]